MKQLLTSLFLICCSLFSYSQNVGIGTNTPDSSAALEIKSSSQGFLPPRITTTQRNAIANPAEGLQIFNTNTKCLQIFAYGFWQNIYCAQSTEQPSTLNNGLVAFYPFNGNANDESGNGNNGVVNGATLTSNRFGNSNKAYLLNGLTDYLSFPSGSSTSLNITGNFTVSYWIKSSSLNGGIVSFGDCVNLNSGGYLSCVNGGNVGLGLVGVGILGQWYGSTNIINDDNWHHILYSLNNGNLKIYIDNILNSNVQNVPNPLSWNGNRFVGCRNDLFMNSNTNFGGVFDDLYIYNRALTQEEITYLATH